MLLVMLILIVLRGHNELAVVVVDADGGVDAIANTVADADALAGGNVHTCSCCSGAETAAAAKEDAAADRVLVWVCVCGEALS